MIVIERQKVKKVCMCEIKKKKKILNVENNNRNYVKRYAFVKGLRLNQHIN